jgi:2-dehydro-3-deoxygluconokinase
MGFSSFGEIMLRLVPAGPSDRIQNSHLFSVAYAGSESNVAISLASLGNKVRFISKVPANPLGEAALQSLNQFEVDTHSIVKGGARLGTYFIELGASIRPSRVIYDRAGAAIAEIRPGEFDWKTLLKDQKWFHVSGITPALSKQCALETVKAVKTARQLGILVSFDLNFRRSLWKDTKMARTIFDSILEHTDLVFGNLGVLKDVYEMEFAGSTALDKTIQALEKVTNVFGIDKVAFTVRDHRSASLNQVSGACMTTGIPYFSPSYEVEVADRFGTGDAFAAAFLHALDKNWKDQNAINFASAAFALKHTIMGDIHTSTEQEINSIADGNTSGHVIR